MLIHQELLNISATDTWSSGSISKNSAHKLNGNLLQVYLESTTSTTTFKAKITDWNNRVIWDSNDYSENIMNFNNLQIPLKDSIYTLTIYSSSAEEAFKVFLGIEE